jgi:putative membrane protein
MTYKTLIAGIALAVAAVSTAAAQGAGADQAFVTKIGGVSMGEVELGQLAQDKTANGEVKGFAQRMIDDHRKSGEELKAIAARKSLTWPAGPSADGKALKDKLSKLSGAAFDRAYIDAMVSGHREVLEVMKTEAQSGVDAEVKAFAAKATSTVQAHLTHALELQAKTGKTATH